MVGIREALTGYTTSFLIGAAGGVVMDYLLEKHEEEKGATPIIEQLGEYGTPSKLVPIVAGGAALVAGTAAAKVPVLSNMIKTPGAAAGLIGFGIGSLGYMLYKKYAEAPAVTAPQAVTPQVVTPQPVAAKPAPNKVGIVLTR